MNRRAFLRRAGGAAIACAVLPLAGCEKNTVEVIAEGTDLTFLTPNDVFFEQYGAEASVFGWPGVQTIAESAWQLTIDGLVSSQQTVTFADLQAETPMTVLKTIRCILDPPADLPGLVGNALWTGVPLRTFLDRAGIDQANTNRLRLYAADGFTNNITLDQVYNVPDDLFEPLLAFRMNGQPLAAEHGAPVRLLMADQYGYKNVKWLTRIEATADDTVFGSYQNIIGYTDDGRIRTVNKATNPLSFDTLPVGPNQITGYAISGFEGIDKVEVSIDGGAFEEARILPLAELTALFPEIQDAVQVQEPQRFAYPFRGVWALWTFDWDAPAGNHTIRIRATDRAGNTQTPTDTDPFDGQNQIFELSVIVE